MDFDALARTLDGHSCADITNICRDASMMTMRRKIKGLTPEQIKNLKKEEMEMAISKADFDDAVRKVNKSVSKEDVERHERWNQDFGAS